MEKLFPACAGVIPNRLPVTSPVEPFPRMRGGDPVSEKLTGEEDAFSPHARG